MRRRDLLAAAAAPWLIHPTFASAAAPAEIEFENPPPFLRYRPLINPSADYFELEKKASAIEASAYARLRDHLEDGKTTISLRVYALTENEVRFEHKSQTPAGLEYTTGRARSNWKADGAAIELLNATTVSSPRPWFRDVTGHLFGGNQAFQDQLRFGIPYWRARLDPATGIDIYGNNGISVGDADGDGQDEIYVCQPGGLPNRLYRRESSGTFSDCSAEAGVDILDDTACALFLDLRNSGRQDLVVLTSNGPLLFLNRSEGRAIRYEFKPGAFRSPSPPRGAFTGMAAADYNRDGRLDLYLCTYIYFQSEDQYRYPVPYHDARNGPANLLFKNHLREDGSGNFEDVTATVALDASNNRYSFAPAWCDYNGDGWPDLYVANDFGRNNLYRNREGRFEDVAREAGVEDLGPGMSAAWFDSNGDGLPDLYTANMWTASGQRVVQDPKFSPVSRDGLTDEYRRHTKGNSLYHNRGDGTFANAGALENIEFGRWAWSADAADFDNDGNTEIFITCGMLTGDKGPDLMSYFWRQVVAHSPPTARPAEAYERGWNLLNQWIREGYHWNGNEPNVFYARKNGAFADHSGVSGLDFIGDSRAFAILDFDGDGRLDLIVKNRLGPQIRAFQNDCATGNAIAFRLSGTNSNRDAIGARIEVSVSGKTFVRWLSAGSGYLSQHTKTIHIGLGDASRADAVRIDWPSGHTEKLTGMEVGFLYHLIENKGIIHQSAFQPNELFPSSPVAGIDDPAVEEAWLNEPLPLPTAPRAAKGPGLFLIQEAATPELAIFRRYLFDYRAPLTPPAAFLLDQTNRVRKFYARPPDAATVQRDLKQMDRNHLPFPGHRYAPTGRSLYRLAAAFLDAGLPHAAIPYLQHVLASDPDNPKALLALGQVHLERGDPSTARPLLEKSARLEPSARAFNDLGGVAMAEQRFQDAAAFFEQALAFDPSAAYAVANAAQAFAKLGQPAKAEKLYRQALERHPTDADSANQLGLLLARQDRRDEARQIFQQAIATRRDHAGAINNLGVLYMQAGQRDDAVAAFLYGMDAAPADETIPLNLARLYVAEGDREKAVAVLDRHLAKQPSSDRVRQALQQLR